MLCDPIPHLDPIGETQIGQCEAGAIAIYRDRADCYVTSALRRPTSDFWQLTSDL